MKEKEYTEFKEWEIKNVEEMKLKTLKDMSKEINCPKCDSRLICPKCQLPMLDEQLMLDINDIRQEAIKWAKVYGYPLNEALIAFFNITQTELK